MSGHFLICSDSPVGGRRFVAQLLKAPAALLGSHRPINLIIGAVGSGKTTAARRLGATIARRPGDIVAADEITVELCERDPATLAELLGLVRITGGAVRHIARAPSTLDRQRAERIASASKTATRPPETLHGTRWAPTGDPGYLGRLRGVWPGVISW